MASSNAIAVVKVNILESKFPTFTDVEIGLALDAHNQSVAYVSYKLALLKADSQAVSIGPISLENNAKYWQNLASMYLEEFNREQRENAESYGGTVYMKRADEIWPR